MATLVRWRIRITIARYRRSPMLFIGPIFGIGLFLLTLWASQGFFRVLVRLAPSFADAVLLLSYAAVGVFQILAGFRWGVTRLFLNSDLELLMCSPITRRRLFGLKILELVVASPISILILGAVTWGYARALNVVAAPLLAIVLPFVLATIAALPGMLVALVLARAMIGPRLRALIGLISPFLPLAWILLFGSASSLFGRVSQRRFDAQHFQRLGRSMVAAIEKSPTSWPGDIVRGIANGNWTLAARSVALVAIVSVALLAVTFAVFFATFEGSWMRLGEASSKRKSGTLIERIAPPIPMVARAIVVKEWRGFTRDLRLLQSLVFPVLILGFFTVNSLRATGSPPYALVFFIAFLVSNQAAIALLMERRNIGFLKLAPVRGIDIITGKVVAYVVPTGILTGAAVVAVGVVRHLSGPIIIVALAFMLWILGGSMLGGVGIAALWGKFDLERPRLGLGPSLLEMVVMPAFAATQGAFGFWIAGRLGENVGFLRSPVAGIPLLVLAGATAFVVAVLATSGGHRLEMFDAP